MASVPAVPVPLERDAEPPSRRARTFRRFLNNPSGRLGLLIVLIFVVATVVAAFWTPYPVDQPDLPNRLASPSWAHPMGTDDVGRDVLTRIAVGARYSLTMGVVAIALAAAVGVPIGLLAGYRGGWWDTGSMRLVDVLMVLPTFVLAVAIVSVLGSGIRSVILAVAVTTIPIFARLTRSVALTVRAQDFVAAAQVVGASESRILVRHVLPNSLSPLVVQASLGIGATILIAAALGFLGLGVQPPTPEWGSMLSRGRSYMSSAPFLVFFPGMAIVLLVLGFNLIGDSLRDALDPWMREID
ncbi:MAG: ABC transporter permease [Thermomicrobiales bacterium]|nr:ABC transporter permease [Thermomicrobiales bacterium]MCO5222240.1 ABC transporter permease [Thermomicrobiales bacterium]